MAPRTTLSALAVLIADAVKVVEDEYAGAPPDLDDPAPHPRDAAFTSMAARRAIQIIEGACAQLCAAVARPSHTVLNRMMEIYEPACLQVAVRFQVPDVLAVQPGGMHITDAARRTGVEQGKLCRVLRLLATRHIFREVSPDVFANNRLSVQLLASNPLSALAAHFTDENSKATVLLADTLADPVCGPSYAIAHTPFSRYTGDPRGLFEYYSSGAPGAAARGARFAVAMQGWGAAVEGAAVVEYFPWHDLPKGATVCDVGSGVGHISLALANAHPHLHLTLQDAPATLAQARSAVWPTLCPAALAEGRVDFVALDFFTEVPVRGCDVYYLKNIIHDWPDAECIRILRNVRAAMAPTSRLLVQDYILQLATTPPSQMEHPPAPAPLLPNFGAGRLRQYTLDLDMLAMMNSRERRLPEFVALGAAAGLSVVRVWDVGEMGVVEFRAAAATAAE